jgi:hypothetical protein
LRYSQRADHLDPRAGRSGLVRAFHDDAHLLAFDGAQRVDQAVEVQRSGEVRWEMLAAHFCR